MERAWYSNSKTHVKSKIGPLEQIQSKNRYVSFFLGHPVEPVRIQQLNSKNKAPLIDHCFDHTIRNTGHNFLEEDFGWNSNIPLHDNNKSIRFETHQIWMKYNR